jgi:hypothetical protein
LQIQAESTAVGLHSLAESAGESDIGEQCLIYVLLYKNAGDGMIMFTQLYVQYYLCSDIYPHRHCWCKILLLKKVNNESAGDILCIFICSGMYFSLSQLYWIGRHSTQS